MLVLHFRKLFLLLRKFSVEYEVFLYAGGMPCVLTPFLFGTSRRMSAVARQVPAPAFCVDDMFN